MTIERAKEILGLRSDDEPAKMWLLGYLEALYHRKNKKDFDTHCRESHAVHELLMTYEDYRLEVEAEWEAERERSERLRRLEHNDGRPLSWVELQTLFAAEWASEYDDEYDEEV